MSFEKVDANLDEGMGEGSEARVRTDNAGACRSFPGATKKLIAKLCRDFSGKGCTVAKGTRAAHAIQGAECLSQT
jgi:hypothetical protein